jgi:predicted transcriptional regulator
MPKQTTVRLPEDLAREAEAVARAQGTSVNQLIIEALHNEIERVRQDAEFRSKVKSIVERDRKILDRLAE